MGKPVLMKYPVAITTATVLLLMLHAATPASSAESGGEYREYSVSEKDALLAQVKERLGAVRTIKARFVQERHLSMFVDILKSGGAMYFESPNKLRWEMTEPYRSILIFNDGKVAKFTVIAGEPRKMNLGMEDVLQEVLKQNIYFMRGDFDRVKGSYGLTVMKGRDYKLLLQPSARMTKVIQSIELHLDPGSSRVTRIVIHETQGDFMDIRFLEEEGNSILPAGLFDLDKPVMMMGPGVQTR